MSAGKLTGADAVEPRHIPVDEAACAVVSAAERQGDRELVRAWLALLFWHMEEKPLEQLRGNPFVRHVRAAAKRLDARSVDLDYGHFHIPAEEDSYRPVTAPWWFDLEADT